MLSTPNLMPENLPLAIRSPETGAVASFVAFHPQKQLVDPLVLPPCQGILGRGAANRGPWSSPRNRSLFQQRNDFGRDLLVDFAVLHVSVSARTDLDLTDKTKVSE